MKLQPCLEPNRLILVRLEWLMKHSPWEVRPSGIIRTMNRSAAPQSAKARRLATDPRLRRIDARGAFRCPEYF
jgi:hypothetical protein